MKLYISVATDPKPVLTVFELDVSVFVSLVSVIYIIYKSNIYL